MLAVFGAPGRYVQGRGATAELGAQMSRLGLDGPALIVTSPAPRRLLERAWESGLTTAGIAFGVLTFGGECSAREIDRVVAAARGQGSRVIVGAGGGKVLDTARAAAAALDVPVVTCPTTASSDAPCSALSVVYADDGAFERYLFYRRNPDLVLVDTEAVAHAPVRLLVAGMGDALATWYEARTVREARAPNQLHGAPTETAGALARLCLDLLLADGPAAVRAVSTRSVTPALERVVEANTLLSGLGFESGGLAVAHSVHNGLTVAAGTHRFLHGEKVAFGLLVQLVVEGRPDSELSAALDFCAAVGLPTTLAAIGLPDADPATLERVARRTLADGETAHHEPFPLTPDMILDAIRAADATGRAHR
ncbi:Glycerol dehydrogenase [Frankia canadensis]|uniref:Glycerol dehydrogenase n=1 Tax=Frankia canadensis TaxID=1836972 RepID=A0A2I2KUI3_9ACTN|nr:glycerol dehydrogenase [Frankia canadensis]SNQ49318.1 Glycerol dehydrogenase [Frankia canadensis]SOU56608.1 Glycerol dehydrogenase [Frankia canadensis]